MLWVSPHDVPDVDHDLYRRGGRIGYDGFKALKHLAEYGPSTIRQIEEGTGRRADGLRRSLKVLAQVELVSNNSDGTWTVRATHWEDAARLLGTHGKADRQRRRHQREQALRRTAVAAWREAYSGSQKDTDCTRTTRP